MNRTAQLSIIQIAALEESPNLSGDQRLERFQKTILIVDDSASVRKLVELTLHRQGYAVSSVTSGLTALASLVEVTPDLVLLDITLDTLSGFQVCQAMRRNPIFANIPVVILSGRASEIDREVGANAGADAYLVKPFKPEQLLSVVFEQLRTATATGVL